MSDKIYFDNIVVTEDETLSEQWTEQTWSLKKKNLTHESVNYFNFRLILQF